MRPILSWDDVALTSRLDISGTFVLAYHPELPYQFRPSAHLLDRPPTFHAHRARMRLGPAREWRRGKGRIFLALASLVIDVELQSAPDQSFRPDCLSPRPSLPTPPTHSSPHPPPATHRLVILPVTDPGPSHSHPARPLCIPVGEGFYHTSGHAAHCPARRGAGTNMLEGGDGEGGIGSACRSAEDVGGDKDAAGGSGAESGRWQGVGDGTQGQTVKRRVCIPSTRSSTDVDYMVS